MYILYHEFFLDPHMSLLMFFISTMSNSDTKIIKILHSYESFKYNTFWLSAFRHRASLCIFTVSILCFKILNIRLNILQNVRICRNLVFLKFSLKNVQCFDILVLKLQLQKKIFTNNQYFHKYIESCRLAILILFLFIICTTWNHNSLIPASRISEYKCSCHDPECWCCLGNIFLLFSKLMPCLWVKF